MSAPSSLPGRSFFFSSGILLVLLLLTAPPAQTSSPAFPLFALVEVTVDFPVPALPSVFSRPRSTNLFADDWFYTPWMYPPDPRILHRVGLGILIDPRGYILTSQHLVGYPGDYQKISVRLLPPISADPLGGPAPSGQVLTKAGAGPSLAVRLVAVDPVHDLALLFINEPVVNRINLPEPVAGLPSLTPGSIVHMVGGVATGSDISGLTLITGEVTRYEKWPAANAQAQVTARLLDPLLGESREVAGLVPVRLSQLSPHTTATTSIGSTAYPSAALLPGSPAFDATGQVVGLVTGLVAASNPHLAFLAPLEAGLKLLADLQENEERFKRITGG